MQEKQISDLTKEQLKTMALNLYRSNTSIAQICDQLKLPKHMVYRWISVKKERVASLARSTNPIVLAAYLKDGQNLNLNKLIIDLTDEGTPVREAAKLLHVSRSLIYQVRAMNKTQPEKCENREACLDHCGSSDVGGIAAAENFGSVPEKANQADPCLLPSEGSGHAEGTASFKLLSAQDLEGMSKEELQAYVELTIGQIKEARKELSYERMRAAAFDRMIEIAERQFRIPIRKKPGAKQ